MLPSINIASSFVNALPLYPYLQPNPAKPDMKIEDLWSASGGSILICHQDTKTRSQVRGFAPIGMVEYWNIGKMGSGILAYWVYA